MMGLGYLGLGNEKEATSCFDKVLVLDNSHLGVITHKKDFELFS
jgi:hypothetical protein